MLEKNKISEKKILINDRGQLITIKQPSILEVYVLYRVILANIKNRIQSKKTG